MKKKLEADLISIAHRILKLKNKSELIQLHQETQKLYEKLSVLRFVEENFENVKPTIGLENIKNKISNLFDDETTVKETENASAERFADTFIETANSNEEEISEVLLEEIAENDQEDEVVQQKTIEKEIVADKIEEKVKEDVVRQIENEVDEVIKETKPAEESLFKPAFELSFDAKEEEFEKEEEETIKVVPVDSQIRFDDLLGPDYVDPVFVKPEEIELENIQKVIEDLKKKSASLNSEMKSTSINDQVSKGIAIGLNDRIGFIKHLFADNTEDYNRVLSQLITFNTLEETKLFIDEMVKPDYNDWEGKDEYSQRFMEIIEKKFS